MTILRSVTVLLRLRGAAGVWVEKVEEIVDREGEIHESLRG